MFWKLHLLCIPSRSQYLRTLCCTGWSNCCPLWRRCSSAALSMEISNQIILCSEPCEFQIIFIMLCFGDSPCINCIYLWRYCPWDWTISLIVKGNLTVFQSGFDYGDNVLYTSVLRITVRWAKDFINTCFFYSKQNDWFVMASYLVRLWTIHRFRTRCDNSGNCRLKSCVHYFVFRRSWFQIWRLDPLTNLRFSWLSRYLTLGTAGIVPNIR